MHSRQIFRVDRAIRRTHDFALFRGARRTWQVAHAAGQRLGKHCPGTYRSNGGHRQSQTCRSPVHYPNLCAFVVAMPVDCCLHAPGAEHFTLARISCFATFAWTGRLVGATPLGIC